MGNKQAALIAEVKSAMDDQGVTMTELARVSGSSLSGMSNALAGRSQMREERWRICCEHLGLDYDEIVNNYPGRGTAKKSNDQNDRGGNENAGKQRKRDRNAQA